MTVFVPASIGVAAIVTTSSANAEESIDTSVEASG
jgi:hypothetical protein